MKATEQTQQAIVRLLHKIAGKYPLSEESLQMTDIHIRVSQEIGEVTAFNDDEEELARSVVEQWINNSDEDFYDQIVPIFRKAINKTKETIDNMSILKPFSLVLEDDDKEAVTELYIVDDDTVILAPELMEGLDKDLDEFLENLLKA